MATKFETKENTSNGLWIVLSFLIGAILTMAVVLLVISVRTPKIQKAVRSEYANIYRRYHSGDQWNVEFMTGDGETWYIKDYATNADDNTAYLLEFNTMGTESVHDDQIICINQITMISSETRQLVSIKPR